MRILKRQEYAEVFNVRGGHSEGTDGASQWINGNYKKKKYGNFINENTSPDTKNPLDVLNREWALGKEIIRAF